MAEIQAVKNKFGIIGNSPKLNYAIEVAMQVAATDLTVLITGESGVGKEAFSQIIHSLGVRKHNPFIAVNCGSIPEGTIDSELFGHEKGAFTGATDKRKGYFETVNTGTIFLDEIGETPLGTQARLLRILESGEYIKVGSSKVLHTDVRVVAATNKNLLEQVQKGSFREDLYYRLNTVPIRVPALRERKEDIELLFRKFSIDFAERYRTEAVRLTPEAVQLLESYPWPGNVRELKNIAEQISVLSKTKTIDEEGLRKYLPDQSRMLPVLARNASNRSGAAGDFASEREILYKLFFDMRKDVTELKRMFFDVMNNPKDREQSYGDYTNKESEDYDSRYLMPDGYYDRSPEQTPGKAIGSGQPIILKEKEINPHEEVEESLTIADKEKELIIKALKKHHGRRRNAAMELGISERTLYRKLKEYNINE